ncbi:hypothetical protein Taro_006540 [Colocasia esculenta]|uniref:Uncharacterized protein n=1 Tax=Colocasia esculenta TaxID=4460 RepID=A0A843TRF2_COLES|nr:hypothetical protein [Colocasia esculenta]
MISSKFNSSMAVAYLLLGTKDETFFDSQECFESDCEDDFFSVNGDLTPSHGSTPIHHMVVAPIKLQQHKAVSVSDGLAEAKSEPSPRKTLAELLQETMAIEPADNEHNIVDEETEVHEKSELNKKIMDQLSNSLDGAPYLSTRNSINGERTPDGNLGNGKEKRGKAKHCCLPSLVHSLSFNDKKPPSPWRHSDG